MLNTQEYLKLYLFIHVFLEFSHTLQRVVLSYHEAQLRATFLRYYATSDLYVFLQAQCTL